MASTAFEDLLTRVFWVGLAFALGLSLSLIGGYEFAWDANVLVGLRALADPSQWPRVPYVVRDITALGGRSLLMLWIALASALLWASGLRRGALFVLFSLLCGLALAPLLKLGFDRPRPEWVEHLVPVSSAAFPSAHAMNAMLVYLTLALVAARFSVKRSLAVILLASALTLAGLVGLSRVYLGVHWPSDVLAGWAFGAAWASASVRWALRRAWLP